MQSAWKDRFGIGTAVRSSDGEKLGKVAYVLEHGFGIEKGLFFPKEYFVRYEDVLEVRGDQVILAHGQEVLRASIPERGEDTGVFEKVKDAIGGGAKGPAKTSRAKAAAVGAAQRVKEAITPHRDAEVDRDAGSARAIETDEIRVPREEEELHTSKHVEDVGQVRVREEVVTEQQQVSVPVAREVRVSKEGIEEQQTLGADARRERADVDTTGPVLPETGRTEEFERSTGTGGRRGR